MRTLFLRAVLESPQDANYPQLSIKLHESSGPRPRNPANCRPRPPQAYAGLLFGPLPNSDPFSPDNQSQAARAAPELRKSPRCRGAFERSRVSFAGRVVQQSLDAPNQSVLPAQSPEKHQV